MPILDLCETLWKTGSIQEIHVTGEILLHSGMTDDDISRVDILLITDTLKCFVNWKPISDKIILKHDHASPLLFESTPQQKKLLLMRKKIFYAA